MIAKNGLLLVSLIAICGNLLAQSELSYEIIGTQKGLSNNHVLCIAEDKTGYLWVGTTSGLNRYNGHDSKIFRSDVNNANTLYNDVIRSLYVDQHNIVWVGQSADGLVSYNQSTGIFTRYPQVSGTIASIFVDDSIAWLGMPYKGLGKLNLKTKKIQIFSLAPYIHKGYSVEDRRNYNSVNVIIKDGDGILWLGAADGLYSFNPRQNVLTPHRLVPDTPGLLRSDYIVSMLYDAPRNALYIPSFDGVKVYQISTGVKEEYKFQQAPDLAIFFMQMPGIGWKGKNEIWLNSSNKGLISFNLETKRFDFDAAKNLGLHPGLIYNSKDYLWLATGQGLVKVNEEKKILTVHPIDYARSFEITSIYADTARQKKYFALGYSKYGLLVSDWKEQTFKSIRCKTINPNGECEVNNLFNIDDRYLLVLSRDFVQVLDKENEIWTNLELGGNIASVSPDYSRALRDKRGNIWITSITSGVGFLDVKTRSFTWFRHDPRDSKSIASDRVRDMIEDPWGRIWLGTTDEGIEIFDFEKSTFTNFNELDFNAKIPFKEVQALTIDKDSTIWIGSITHGLYALNIGKTPFFKSSHVSVSVAELATDKNGLIWILETAGNWLPGYAHQLIIYNAKKDLSRVFDSNDSGHQFYSIIDNYGTVIVGSNNGYYTTNDSGLLFSENKPLPLVINSMKIEGEEVGLDPSGGKISLPYNKNSVLIEFSNIDFSSSPSTQYLFKLDGLETQWNKASNFQRQATYSKLRPGSYVFKIKSVNLGFGETSEKALVSLEIEPPFWDTIWFETFIFLLVVGLVSVSVSYFVNRSLRESSLRQKLSNAQLVALRTQMNPHFIFNSLNAIQGLIIRSDVVKATQFTAKFSKLIRKVLENSEKQLVLLQEEIENLNLYLSVESIRFDGRFDYTIDQSDEILFIEIPSLVIQPVVENIIWQNLGQSNAIKKIAIQFFRENDNVCCTIKHNVDGTLVKSSLTLPEKAVGMKLTASRLAMISSGSKIIETDIIDELGGISERLVKIIFDLKSISSSKKTLAS